MLKQVEISNALEKEIQPDNTAVISTKQVFRFEYSLRRFFHTS